MTYAAEQAAALADIRAAGTAVTFQRSTTTFTPSTGMIVQGTTASWTGYALVKRPFLAVGTSFEQAALIRQNQRDLLVAAKGLTSVPVPGDRVVFAGATWDVLSVDPLDLTGSEPILYTVRVKR